MLGFAGQLDSGAVTRPVASHLGPHERDRRADGGEHLGMLGPDQRAPQALGHERDERLARAAQCDERHVGAKVVVARGVRNRLDDLLDGSVEQLLCRASPASSSAARQAERTRPAPPPGPRTSTHPPATSPSAFAAQVTVSA